jgi:hypothetical protein
MHEQFTTSDTRWIQLGAPVQGAELTYEYIAARLQFERVFQGEMFRQLRALPFILGDEF